MKPVAKLLLAAALFSSHGYAMKIQKWDRIPIALPLQVGQERIVFVDQNVRVGIPGDLAGKLRVQSTGGAVYLLASEPIPPTRLQLQNVTTGELILVDIMAEPGAEGEPALESVKIVPGDPVPARYGQTTAKARSTTAALEEEAEPAAPKRETPIPVVLTRYAAQMMYAPLRTVEPVTGVGQVRVKAMDLSTVLPTRPVKASALGAWRLDDFTVTAVKLQNTSGQQLKLDPRELMGNFVSAAFQHPYLGAYGQATDTTTLYLVTQGKGLSGSVLPATNQIDPRGGHDGSTKK